jgi:hypothetical protein
VSADHDGLVSRLRGRRAFAAALILAGSMVLVLLPLAWIVSVGVGETLAGIDFVREVLRMRGPQGFLSTSRAGRLARSRQR